MFVKKFEADTLDEALKNIKSELGPDAIILKTVTNKGLKGALKRKKIEITAAISEKDIKQKSAVDMALGDNKEKFYNNDSSHISKMINNYSSNNPTQKNMNTSKSGYGNAGLNKFVKQKDDQTPKRGGLDDFLKSKSENKNTFDDTALREPAVQVLTQLKNKNENQNLSNFETVEKNNESIKKQKFNSELIHNQELKLENLEKRIIELSSYVERSTQKDPKGVQELRNLLSSFSISNTFTNKLIKNALFEFSEEDMKNGDMLIDYALREMNNAIKVEMPKFCNTENKNKSNIVLLISDVSSGQGSLAKKIASNGKNFSIIKNHGDEKTFTDKMLDINSVKVQSVSEIISQTRKEVDQNNNVLIDYRTSKDNNETKTFINGLKRSFSNIEVIIVASAIHSEEFNRNYFHKYKNIADSVSYNYLDLCVNYGQIFNLSYEFSNLAINYFGTGEVVPDDIETATAERVLGCILNLE